MPLGKALKRQIDNLQDACQHSIGAYGDIAAVFEQGGVEHDTQQALRALHDKGGNAQSQHGKQDVPADFQILRRIGERFLTAQEREYPYCGNCLSENSGDGRSCHAHVEYKDEQGSSTILSTAPITVSMLVFCKALGGDEHDSCPGNLYKMVPQT